MQHHFVTKIKQRLIFFAIGLCASIGSFAQQIPPVRVFQVDTELYPKGPVDKIIPFRGGYIKYHHNKFVWVNEGKETLLDYKYIQDHFGHIRDQDFVSKLVFNEAILHENVYYGVIYGSLFRQNLDQTENVEADYEVPRDRFLQLDTRKERLILNLEVDENPHFKIFDAKTLKEIKSGKGVLWLSSTGRYFWEKPKVWDALTELDQLDFKPLKTYKRTVIEDGISSNDFRFETDFTSNGYKPDVLCLPRVKRLIYISEYGEEFMEFTNSTDPFDMPKGLFDMRNLMYYYINSSDRVAEIYEKSILTGAVRIVYTSDYVISTLNFSSDSTSIHVGINLNITSFKKQQEIDKEWAERSSEQAKANAEKERLLAAENKRIQEEKDSLKRIEDERLAQLKKQEEIKAVAARQSEKLKQDSTYLRQIAFYLKSKNTKLQKLNPEQLSFKKRGYGIYQAIEKDGSDWYTAFNQEAIVVLNPQKKQVNYYAYPAGMNPEEMEIRLMFNNHFLLINHNKSEIWIVNPLKGVIGSVYALRQNSPVLTQIQWIPDFYGIALWNATSRRLDHFFLKHDKLLLRKSTETHEQIELMPSQCYRYIDTTDRENMESAWNSKTEYIGSKGKTVFWYKPEAYSENQWKVDNFGPVVNSPNNFTLLYSFYDIDNYYLGVNSLDPIGYSTLYESDGFRIRKYNDDNEKLSLRDLPVLVENYSESKEGYFYQFYALNGDEYEYEKYRQIRYKASNSFINQGYDAKNKRRLVLSLDASGKAYLLALRQNEIQLAVQLNNASELPITEEIKKMAGTRTLVESTGEVYASGSNPPLRESVRKNQEEYNREMAEKRAAEEAMISETVTNESKPAKENLTEGLMIYKGVSQQKLVIEIQVRVWYENVRVKDLVFNAYNWEKKVHYEEPMRFRYPQNSQQWMSFGSNSFYECTEYENRIFSYPQRCASIQGMVFGLIRVD